ncbi:MAG: hypothetical protein WBB36_06865 [Chitinophagales bacterium]
MPKGKLNLRIWRNSQKPSLQAFAEIKVPPSIANIDKVLFVLYDNSKWSLSSEKIIKAVNEKGLTDNEAIIRYLARITADKYVYPHGGDSFHINHNGVLFWEIDGGYSGKYTTQNLDKQIGRRNENLLRGYTLALAIGAIGLVLWEMIAFYLEHFYFCQCN